MNTNPKLCSSIRIALAVALLCAFPAGSALATPSTQIWIPSTDIQGYKTVHLNIDTYARAKNNDDGSRTAPVWVIGPTVGILPFAKIQAEVGFDLITQGGNADKYPLYGHGKVGTPEDAWFKGSPAIAVGMYNIGTKSGDARKGELATNQDLAYGLIAKTLPVVGRLSAGYYVGNKKVLVTEEVDASGNLKSDEKGLLLSWDRTMTEISDKLWLAVDYQGGESGLGALSFGASWAFAKNTSVILGYDVYNNKDLFGKGTNMDTWTVQVDINFP
ncbi:MAG: hypothetical protein M0Z38_05850 [Deltaproteobacteria bacterium]|nr:hypothetical protein [Deltaproteobacteria bacterium]